MTRISERTIKAFEKFQAELKAFGEETGEVFVTLYEDANTTRQVANFRLYKNAKLKWVEANWRGISEEQVEIMEDDDDAKEWLKFWKANLRRAKKYWSMDSEKLDRIQDGLEDDIED